MRRLIGVLMGFMAVFSLVGPVSAAITYNLDKVADMNLSYTPSSRSMGINGSGSIASYHYLQMNTGSLQSFVFTADVLHEFPFESTLITKQAVAVNDAGMVVGTGSLGNLRQGFLAKPLDGSYPGDTLRLGTVDGFTSPSVTSINNATPAQIVGSALSSTTQYRTAVVWNAETLAATDLGFMLGATWSHATDINDAGVIVGNSLISGIYHPFLRQPNGVVTELPFPTPSTSCQAWALNNAGLVVGDCFFPATPTTAQVTKPVLWDAGLAPKVLPVTSNDWTYSKDINAVGQIVGQAVTQSSSGNTYKAVLWEAVFDAFGNITSIAGPIDLQTVVDATSGAGWTLECAGAINTAGQIGGWGKGLTGNYEFFRLTPQALKTATISISPGILTFFNVLGQTPPPQNVAISNAGTGAMNWTVTSGASFLSASPTSGSGPGTISVSVNTSGLWLNSTYASNLTITSAEATNSPLTLGVTLKAPVAVTQPLPGEILTGRENYNVYWVLNKTYPTLASFDLYYATDVSASKVSWKLIAGGLASSTHNFVWTVPALRTPSDKCRVKVVLKDGARKPQVLAEGLSDIFSIH